MNWTPDTLDRLERAIADGCRIQIYRRGTEYVVLPQTLRNDIGTEVLVATHPGTGERIEFALDEVESFTILG